LWKPSHRPEGRLLEDSQQRRQRVDVLAVDLDELERRLARFARLVDRGMNGLDQRRLAHAARTPQKRVVRRQPGREPLRIVEEDIADPVHAADEIDIHPVDLLDRFQVTGIGLPYKAVGRRKVRPRHGRRRQALYGPYEKIDLFGKQIGGRVRHFSFACSGKMALSL
jgi:hypothetical protein